MTEWGTLQAHTHGIGHRQQHIASLTDRHLLEKTRTGTQCHRFQPREPSAVLPPTKGHYVQTTRSYLIATIQQIQALSMFLGISENCTGKHCPITNLTLYSTNLIDCVFFPRQKQMLVLPGAGTNSLLYDTHSYSECCWRSPLVHPTSKSSIVQNYSTAIQKLKMLYTLLMPLCLHDENDDHDSPLLLSTKLLVSPMTRRIIIMYFIFPTSLPDLLYFLNVTHTVAQLYES